MKKHAMIVDIDGTLADNAHRQHHLEGDKKDWEAFFAALHLDAPKMTVADGVRSLALFKGWDVLLVSGRGEEQRGATVDWIGRHLPLLQHLPLYMRPKGDRRPDTIVKREIYEREIKPRWDVKLVFDDRGSVVKMWRELGLECWQVAEGAF